MRLKQYLISLSIILVFCSVTTLAQVSYFDNQSNSTTSLHFKFESNSGDSILQYQGYTIIYSFKYNLPRYAFHTVTLEQLTVDKENEAVRRNSYRVIDLPNGNITATANDYKGSGYDRGHLVPAGDFAKSQNLKDETFFYTNIAPQKDILNRGIWLGLEDNFRSYVIDNKVDVYVVTGSIFDEDCTVKIGPNDLCVPLAYFKILYNESENKMFAFMFDHSVDRYYGTISDFQVSVNDIEKITGEDFFDKLDDPIEDQLESMIKVFK